MRLILISLFLVFAFSGAVRAQDNPCANMDPANYDQVYACISWDLTRKGTRVAELPKRPCQSFKMNHLALVTKAAGISRKDAEKRVPSCAMFARVVHAMSGKGPFWETCTDWNAADQPEHLKNCLSAFVPGYYGRGRTAEDLEGCGDVFKAYELALGSADPDRKLPAGYARPDCKVAAEFLASVRSTPTRQVVSPAQVTQRRATAGRPEWEACMEYDPAGVETHLRNCLGSGPELLELSDCESVRAAYEKRLSQAYGKLPDNYLVLPCSATEGIVEYVAAEKERIAEAKAQARLEKRRRVAMANLNTPRPDRGFFSGAVITWTIGGALLALILFAGFILIGRRGAKS